MFTAMPAYSINPRDHRPLLMAGKWYSQLEPALQDAMLGIAVVRSLQDGERLFSRGDRCCGMYAVLAGMLRISGLGGTPGQPREAVLAFVEAPDWFGEIAIVDGQPRTHDAVADGPCLVLHLAQAPVGALLASHPPYWRALALLMSHKLRLMFSVAEETALLPAPVRAARRLLLMSEGLGGRQDPGMRRRTLKVSQEQFARMLSISRQSANQILGQLEQQGLIRLHRMEIEILDFAGLLAVAPGTQG